MKKKIFIGVKLSSDLQKKILAWQEKHSDFKVRWLKPENLHLTLVPPWFEENIEEVKEKMSLLKGELRPFILKFDKITIGPNGKHKRLIWLEGKGEEYKNLAKKMQKYFSVEDKREILPHVTIARFKSFAQELQEKIDWPEEVNNLTLFESLGNSEYKVLYDLTF